MYDFGIENKNKNCSCYKIAVLTMLSILTLSFVIITIMFVVLMIKLPIDDIAYIIRELRDDTDEFKSGIEFIKAFIIQIEKCLWTKGYC